MKTKPISQPKAGAASVGKCRQLSVSIGNVTVKIYSRTRPTASGGKRTIYEVADYTAGTRRLQSFSDLATAKAEAQRIAGSLATADTTAASFRGADAASYGRAVEILRNAGLDTPLELVAAIYADAVKILGTDKIVVAAKDYVRRNPSERPPRSVREVADELIEVKTKRKASERYLQDLKYQLAKLADKFAVNVDTVTTADLQSWFDGMDAAPRSIRNVRSVARSFFKFAEARGYIAKGENPATETERIEAKNGDDVEIYTPDELARLLAAAPDSIKPVIAIQAFAGIRTAEVMRLDWQAVKLDRAHIEIKAGNAKTQSRRIVPIVPNLAAWLKAAAAQTGKIFPDGADRYHELQRAAAAATEIEANPKKKIAAQPAIALKANALRHSFISYRLADIKNVAQVALEAGNSPAMIFAHYNEAVAEAEAKTWFAIAPAQPANVVNLPIAKAA